MGVARAVVNYADSVLYDHLTDAVIAVERRDDVYTLLRCMWEAALACSASDADLFADAHLHWRHPQGREAPVDQSECRSTGFLEELLAAGMAAGQLAKRPVAIVGAFVWGALVQVVKERAASRECDADLAFEMVWRAIAPSTAAGPPPGRNRPVARPSTTRTEAGRNGASPQGRRGQRSEKGMSLVGSKAGPSQARPSSDPGTVGPGCALAAALLATSAAVEESRALHAGNTPA